MGVLDDERREHYSQTKSRIGETGGEEKGEENAAAQLSAAAQRGTKLRHTKHSPTTFPFPSPVQRNSAETTTVFFLSLSLSLLSPPLPPFPSPVSASLARETSVLSRVDRRATAPSLIRGRSIGVM